MITLLVFMTTCHALFSEDLLNRSITLGISGVYVYKDDFGGLAPGYGGMITYNYHLSEDYLLGINLLRYELHPGSNPGLMSFSYGFTFQHFWKKSWGDLGNFLPYLSYSILLNQGILAGVSGRALAHNTRIALGMEVKLEQRHHLGLEGLWNYASYGYFGMDGKNYQNAGLGLNYRYSF